MFQTDWFLLNTHCTEGASPTYGKSHSLRSALRLCGAISSECVCVFSFSGLPCTPQRLRGRLMSCVMLCFPLFWLRGSLMLTRAVCAWAGPRPACTHRLKVHSYQWLCFQLCGAEKPATDVCPIRISLLWARKAVTTIHLHASIFIFFLQAGRIGEIIYLVWCVPFITEVIIRSWEWHHIGFDVSICCYEYQLITAHDVIVCPWKQHNVTGKCCTILTGWPSS